MYSLPQQNWTQLNASNRFGSIAYSKNIDLDLDGYLKLANRSRAIFDQDTDAQFGLPLSIVYDVGADQYWVLTDNGIFEVSTNLLTIAQNADTGVPTIDINGADMIIFNGEVHVAAGTTSDLRSYNGTTWDTDYALTSSVAPMAIFEDKVQLAIGQSNTVILLDTSYTLVETLTLPDQYRVTSLDWSDNFLWIGTRNRFDGEAMLFAWDGNETSFNQAFPVGCSRVDCVKRYRGTVVIMTGDGRLLAYNGGGFAQIAALPGYFRSVLMEYDGSTVLGLTSHRGMVVDGERIYTNLRTTYRVSADNDLQREYDHDAPGGVWCYDPQKGFYHKYSLSTDLQAKTNAVTTANVNTTTEVITVAGATVPPTGTPVIYDDGGDGALTAIGGLTHRKKYYVINESSSTMKLATTKANADANTEINLTGTGNNAQFFIFNPNRDFGGGKVASPGAVFRMVNPDPVPSDGRHLLFGGSIGKTTVTSEYTLNTVVNNQENRGIVVTGRLDAQGKADVMAQLTVKYDGVTTAEDKIIVKIKTAERYDELKFLDVNNTNTGTWSDANTFTTTADLSAITAGDEVTIHSGSGMGYTFHVDSISEAGGTYTVNLTESAQNITATETMLFTVDTFEYLGEITTSDSTTKEFQEGTTFTRLGGVKDFGFDDKARFIQVKLELRGEGIIVEDLLVNNKPFDQLIV